MTPVTVKVLAVVEGVGGGPDVAHVAIRKTNASVTVPAATISADTGLPVSELVGKEFDANMRVEQYETMLSGFRLLNDPRL